MMNISQQLTPFSQSILFPAIKDALHRAALHEGVRNVEMTFKETATSDDIYVLLAMMTTAVWGTSPTVAGDLFGVVTPQVEARGKMGQGIKSAQRTLEDFPQAYGRMKRWSEWVFASEWSQAQLLQVMEEIEPMVKEAMTWMNRLAIAAVGSYAHLGDLIAKFEQDDVKLQALHLGLMAGLETPDGQLIGELEVGISAQKLQEHFGHLAPSHPCEIALPRIGENVHAFIGDQSPPESMMWDLSRAQGREMAAMTQANARVGFLRRAGLRKAITVTRGALAAHAKARDGLAHVLAATRHWAQAAAGEGLANGRIHSLDEIFMLEIEEIKQMMTGEWHSRNHVEPLIAQRRSTSPPRNDAPFLSRTPLGVAGQPVQGYLKPLPTPEAVAKPSGFIALTSGWTPAWWRVILMAEGVVETDGNLLSWIASVARMGDLPALVGGYRYADWPSGTNVQLDPSRSLIERLTGASQFRGNLSNDALAE